MKCAYALSVKTQQNLDVTKCLHFDPNSDGKTVWDDLHEQGGFSKCENGKSENVYGEMGVGVAAQATMQAGAVRDVEMCLVWDMPLVTFTEQRKKYFKYYTKYFGATDACLKIVDFAFKRYKDWEKAIYGYQRKVLDDKLVL